jgi:hypothetical protein
VVILKYDRNGNLLWQNLDADGSGLSLLALAPMKLDGLNAVYIAGSTMSQMGVCKVNSDGTSAWAATTSSGYPVCMDFGTDNSVYVTGGTTARFTQTGSLPAPAAPTNLTAVASGTSAVNLTWTDNATNETGYVLQRSLSASSGFTTIATLAVNTTSYSNSGLNSSTTYYYRIQSVNSNGSSAWSNVANATTAVSGPPAAPANLYASAKDCNTIVLTWSDKSNNETSFELRRSLSQYGTYSTVATLAANTTTYNNTGLTKGRKYYYRIRAGNSSGNSSWSNNASATAFCNAASKSEEVVESINLYPNPATNGVFYLDLPAEITFPVILEMYSLTGQKILQKELTDYSNTIETFGLKNGLYIISVNSNGKVQKLKLQINK